MSLPPIGYQFRQGVRPDHLRHDHQHWLVGDARDRALRDYWKSESDFVDVDSTASSFDPRTGERRLSMTGNARMDWTSGWYPTDGMAIGYRAHFTRDAGLDGDAPYAVPYPQHTRTMDTVLLPQERYRQNSRGHRISPPCHVKGRHVHREAHPPTSSQPMAYRPEMGRIAVAHDRPPTRRSQYQDR
ncbi:MAG: hypothetical protein EOP66_06130 [Sphingomonas sp.]|nr:MAG: hypothetical protein EOP66_06130 [Sphingomonas sp.]